MVGDKSQMPAEFLVIFVDEGAVFSPREEVSLGREKKKRAGSLVPQEYASDVVGPSGQVCVASSNISDGRQGGCATTLNRYDGIGVRTSAYAWPCWKTKVRIGGEDSSSGCVSGGGPGDLAKCDIGSV